MKIKRPALRYHGGKWNIGRDIISLFPKHDVFVDLFGGGNNIIIQKPRVKIEVYNDIDSLVYNFFKVLRDNPAELIRRIELTPYSVQEFRDSYNGLGDAIDPIERARLFFIRSFMSITATNGDQSGFRRNISREIGSPAAASFSKTDHLYQITERLQGVTIENDTWENIFNYYNKHPYTLFYADPPYLPKTRINIANVYNYEMTAEDHAHLLKTLKTAVGFVAVSGYDSELYNDLLTGWGRVEIMSRTNGHGKAKEIVWLSPNIEMGTMRAIRDGNDYSSLFMGVTHDQTS